MNRSTRFNTGYKSNFKGIQVKFSTGRKTNCPWTSSKTRRRKSIVKNFTL